MHRPCRLPLLLLSLSVLFSCRDGTLTEPAPDPAQLSALSSAPIVDGAHGGNDNFFFLPPLVRDPRATGEFNPELSPVVEICALNSAGTDCAVPQPAGLPLRFTMGGGGPDAVRVDERDEHYAVNWRTSRPALNPDVDYRIRVRPVEGAEPLGHIDVDLVAPGRGRAGGPGGGAALVRVQQNATLPIRFRIEQGALCDATLDCIETVVGTAGATVLAPSDAAGVEIPEGALDAPVVIIIERIDVTAQPCLPSDLLQAEGCYRFDTEPALSAVQTSGLDEFNEFVTVGVCLDPDVLESPEHHQYALHKYDPEQPQLGIVELPSAPAPWLDCEDFTALALGETNHVLRLAQAGWRTVSTSLIKLLGPRAAHALNLGFGGLSKSFSQIGWARPLEFSLLAGGEQTGLAGTTLPVDPAVLVTAVHWNPEEEEGPPVVPGVEVTFTFTDASGGMSVVNALTDAAGVASVPWLLGAAGGTNTLVISGPGDQAVTVTAEGVAELLDLVRVAAAPDESEVPTFPTIEAAYASVAPGGTVLVAEGLHPISELSVQKAVRFEAESLGENEYVDAVVVVDEGVFGFYVENLTDPDGVWFEGLIFTGGLGAIWARTDYTLVGVEAGTFESARGVVADQNANPQGRLEVSNSAFEGGLIGILSLAPVVDIRDNELSEYTAMAIYTIGGTGVVNGNTLSVCPGACIRIDQPVNLEINDNVVTNAAPHPVSDGIHVSGNPQSGVRGVIELLGNEVVGTGGTPQNPAFGFGIRVGFNTPGLLEAVIEGNTVSGASNGIAVAATIGTIADNDVNGCGFACINVAGSGESDLELLDNTIEGDQPTTYGILAQSGPSTVPWAVVRGNGIIGADPEGGYVLNTGIGVHGQFGTATVEVTDNLIQNVAYGVHASSSGSVIGRDNRIEDVNQGLRSSDNASLSIRFSDILNSFTGLGGAGQFAVTCNWWGTPNGPNIIEDDIDIEAYSPWAFEPIAGTEATGCE